MISAVFVKDAIWRNIMDEIIYKGNKILCFSSNDFQAFIINKDGEVESETFTTLPAAQKWIDKYGTKITCSEEI